MNCWGSAVVGDPAGVVVVRSLRVDDCPCRVGVVTIVVLCRRREELVCVGVTRAGPSGPAGVLWGFSQKSRDDLEEFFRNRFRFWGIVR